MTRGRGIASVERPPAFQVRAGCVDFDGVHVLDHLDLTIDAGSFVALLGANGSGKSTLVRAMLGLQSLSHGQVLLHGRPVSAFTAWGRVAFVPQRLPQATGVPISVLELVSSAAFSPRTRFRRSPRRTRRGAEEALDRVGLLHRRHDRMDTLSGGQQRRVMIARALFVGADTLVMDEPMAGVDLVNQQHLATLLASLMQEGRNGTGHPPTVLVVAHGLGTMADLVTRAIVLDEGRIVHDGPQAPPDWADVHHHLDGNGPPTLLEGR